MVTDLIGCDIFCIYQSSDSGRVITGLPVGAGNVDQEAGTAFDQLRWHPLEVYRRDMFYSPARVSQFDSDGNSMDSDVGRANTVPNAE